MKVSRGGIRTQQDGRVIVDKYGRTSAARVWALGDVSSPYQLKHVANHEARTVAANLRASHENRSLTPFRHTFVPSAVFSEPQIASVGATGQRLRERGTPFVEVTQRYGDTAFGWAMEDEHGICLLYADPGSALLLGAHILGPQASTLIQPLIQAMALGQTVREIANGQFWIHPALTELVEKALLSFPKAMSANY